MSTHAAPLSSVDLQQVQGLSLVLEWLKLQGTESSATLEAAKAHFKSCGAISTWRFLSNNFPELKQHDEMLEDALVAVAMYGKVRGMKKKTPCHGLTMTVRSGCRPSAVEIGPKTLGGKLWKLDSNYAAVASRWNGLQVVDIPPCPAWIWHGMMKKIIPDAVMDEAACLQMLSSVDYDMDRRPEFKHAFEHSLGVAKMCLSSPENGMRGLALAALLSYDIQQLVRMQHERWIREQHGAFSFGDLDMSPEECIPLAVGDCGGQGPYGYQNSEQYRLGKPSMFISMIVANSHDVLYDICSQNRVSNILYAEVKGGSLENWHTVLAHSGMDSIAERINLLKEGEVPLYGDTAALGTGCWAPFNGRYRSLERYIKYSKLLKRSQHPDAGKIMALSRQQWVYQDYNITHSDLVAYWKLSIDSDGIRQTKPRTRHTYKVVMDERLLSGDSILKGLDICGDCHGLLADKISNAQYSVTSAIELSPSVANASSVQWASLLVQVANWCSELQVCSTCAALIGNRLDEMAYHVLVELMKNEPKTSAKDFLAEQYAVWCSTTAPISIASILSGFDLRAQIVMDQGAMGERDTVDC